LIEQGPDRQFQAAGLARKHWSNAGAIRAIFKEAFESAGLPGFNPHSFRHALAMLGELTLLPSRTQLMVSSAANGAA
jgi:integrase